MINDCEPHDDDPEAGITLRCGFDFHQLGSDALGIGPYRDNYWELTVRDGEIVSAAIYLPPFGQWNDETWVRERRSGESERRGQGHPVHVAGRRRLGCVEVAVGVDPEHAARPPCSRGQPGERAQRDRVIAPEHEGEASTVDGQPHLACCDVGGRHVDACRQIMQ